MRHLFGLRVRIVLALLAVTVVALSGAAVALFVPLEHRLRDDALSTLAASAVTARDEIARLPASALTQRSPRLESVILSLRRVNVETRVVNASGQQLGLPSNDLAIDRNAPSEALERAVARGRPLRQVIGSGANAEAIVVEPARTAIGPVTLGVRTSLKEVDATRSVFRAGFVRAAIVSLAVALVLGTALATPLVRRIRTLRAKALQVANAGPGASEPPRGGGHDEIGDLTRAFGSMQERLTVQEEARKAFVSTASHELRTPIAVLQLRLGLLREDLAGSAPDLGDAREQVVLADEQAGRLGRLASDLLDLSRIDADVPLRREAVPLVSLCRSTIAEFNLGRTGAAVELSVRGERESGNVALGDPGAIAQVVRILVDNARRHAPPGDAVRVVATGPTILVEDDGPGVAEEEREQIFERFRRGRGHDSHAGFGLGLAIGRELARRMGGELALTHASGPTRFELTLPRAAPPDRPPG